VRQLQPVIWSKGAFLAPQHLQAQDRFIESSLHFWLDALVFRPWGFRELALDQEKLAAGAFGITRASGILGDGLLFDMPDSDPLPPAKPLTDDCFDQDQDTVQIYLALPESRERSPNVAMNRAGTDARYSAQVLMLPDENSGLAERPIQLGRKNFRFLVEGEVREGNSALKIARVKRTKAKTFEIDNSFVPPLLNYAASEYLVSLLTRLVEILSAKSTSLGQMRRQQNQALAGFSASDVPNFWLLYTVNSYFPLLNHLFEAQESHPERLFTAMLALAGALSAFSNDIHPRDMPVYDHNNLYPCFSDLDAKLRQLLEKGVRTNFVALPLKYVQPSIYATSIADDKYFAKTKMYLAINAEMKKGDLVSKTLELVKVGSANYVEHAVKMGLAGMPLAHVESPPDSIPFRLNYKYFTLDQVGPAWDAIKRERHLAAYVPGDLPNPQLELIVVFL
jgi:type VI secretion system protein ImpJ